LQLFGWAFAVFLAVFVAAATTFLELAVVATCFELDGSVFEGTLESSVFVVDARKTYFVIGEILVGALHVFVLPFFEVSFHSVTEDFFSVKMLFFLKRSQIHDFLITSAKSHH